MRNLLSVLLLLLPFFGFCQLEAGNFKVTSDGYVIWQKVYDNPNVTFDDLINTVKGNRVFSDIQVADDKITFLASGIKTDPRSSGFSPMSTSFYALGDIRAYFTIDYKEGRYRITGVNIASKMPVIHLGDPSYAQNPDKWQYTPIEESVGNGKGLKKDFIKKESKIMSDAIEWQFRIIKNTASDDNW